MQRAFEKIIERLEKETDCPNCSMYCADADMCGFDEMRKQAIEIVNQVASEVGGGWIPCSERLPEEYGNYNVSCKNDEGKEWTTTMVWDNGYFGGQESFHRLVTAYQPLPEPYKAESEE